MRWNKRLNQLEKRIPPQPRLDPRMCEMLQMLERRYGGVRENGRLTAVNFADGRCYALSSEGAVTPDLAHAILIAAGEL